jgi:hypothetical protein
MDFTHRLVVLVVRVFVLLDVCVHAGTGCVFSFVVFFPQFLVFSGFCVVAV